MSPSFPLWLPLAIVVLGAIPEGSKGAAASRILGVFPHPGRTHFLVFEPLLKRLAERGHEVVVIGHYPQREPQPRYFDVDISGSHEDKAGKVVLDEYSGSNLASAVDDFMFITQYGQASCEPILGHPAVRALVDSGAQFDLVIVEAFNTNCFLGLVHRFWPAPYIAMSSCELNSFDWRRVGNLRSPAVLPNVNLWYTDEMTFSQRALNALYTLWNNVYMERVMDPMAQEVVERYLGPGVPPLSEIAMNVSLLLLNTYPALSTAKSLVPAVVEIGGVHIPSARPLPEDLEKFVAGAKHGVVMFSMGSMIRASSMPVENAAALLRAFGTLKQRVIWKWEADPPAPLPKNVLMLKWLPQFDVLCHNNTRLFIGHGGLLSTSEAAYCGVPLLGVAMYGDQRTNLAAAAKAGTARSIPYSTLKEADVFLKHIDEMLKDPSYRENAKILSERFRDRPMSPLDTAVYWTEYVIRHKGAPHLRSAARNLSWWQEALLDVVAVVLLAAGALLVLLVAAVKLLLRFLFSVRGVCSKAMRTSKQKKA